MLYIKAVSHQAIPIGKPGEDNTRTIVFDVSSWINAFGVDGITFELVHKRKGDSDPYPCVVSWDGTGTVNWTIHTADVANIGPGECELIMYRNGTDVLKSMTYQTITSRISYTAVTPPEAQQSWVDTVVAAGATATSKADEAAESATEAASSASAASGSAGIAATEASAALASASSALESATAAVSSATEAASARDAAVTAQGSAETAADNAQGYASAASGSAEAAAASAKSAADDAVAAVETEIKGYVESAGKSATAAETAQGKAEAAQTAAETAQGKSEAAQTAAETAASSVSASAAQIATNTSDISELKKDLSRIQDMTSEAEQTGDYAGYHLGFYLDENGDLCQKED